MRNTRRPLSLLAVAVLIIAGTFTYSPHAVGAAPTELADTSVAHAAVRDADGRFLGVVTLQSAGAGKLAVAGRLTGLTAGFHGFHIHTVGICDATTTDPAGTRTPFVSAGGHLNPSATTHGHHAGDLPMLLVTTDGSTRSMTETSAVRVADLFDADGSALIVHAGTDNAANIPTRYVSSTTNLPGPDAATLATGDSGGRFACGVITRS
jgi:Cu-Zn family superoxide dismutase